ncbi:MAG: HEAT repeat domain-containing protein [Candidatus Loosdrechtia sp.]|uniref:HEAT repeat domain-containing protein n=1 Tax=Candidatus Loosdrechtia sp. TaxID=3101272 RepID=UPI003A765A29|nr:MAG: HEAT repeat domain-containing protein [Candidatus Jettenia sp. AMX2]
MIFFCPICWKEIKEIDKSCPFCHASIAEFENKSFEEKLINALRHPERETVHRAVYILGKLRSIKAVKPVIGLFEQTNNTFLKIRILSALHEIGVPEANEFILKVVNSDAGMIKRIAKELIEKGSTS